MPEIKRAVSRLQNIKTLSGRLDELATPYKAYMKLSILEMEKYRRNKEKATALERLRVIEARFLEIEKEKQQTLEAMEVRDIAKPHRVRSFTSPVEPCQDTGSFKIRY